MSRRIVASMAALGVLLAIMAVVLLAGKGFSTYLHFSIRDEVSKSWVWDATITLQNRTIRSFYQSDRGIREYRFSNLKPGDFVIRASSPGYRSLNVPISLKRGSNRLDNPIELTGFEIPDLQYFLLFEQLEGADIKAELRPVDSSGTAILNHPCLDLWIGARVSVQMDSGGYVTEPTDEGSFRGEELFRGRVEWEWDAAPETIFRYWARIPGSVIRKHEAPFLIVDYLIVVPKPGAENGASIDSIVNRNWSTTDLSELGDFLDKYESLFSYYVHTSWNVRGT